MLLRLITLFTITPLVELYLLFKLSDLTSPSTTIAIVLLTGIIGAYLAKSQGRIILNKIKVKLSYGDMPGDELINGLCVLIGGALLLTPGIITDFLGFTLVLPGTRDIYKIYIKEKLRKMIDKGDIHIYRR